MVFFIKVVDIYGFRNMRNALCEAQYAKRRVIEVNIIENQPLLPNLSAI
jgi:hypothetical protein